MMISSTRSATDARQSGRLCSSFLTIMHSETRMRRWTVDVVAIRPSRSEAA